MVLERAVTNFAEAAKVDRTGEGVASFTFVGLDPTFAPRRAIRRRIRPRVPKSPVISMIELGADDSTFAISRRDPQPGSLR